MRGDGLRALDRAAVQQIRRDPRRPEGMAVRSIAKLRVTTAPFNHPEHIDPAHPAFADAALFRHAAPERRVFVPPKPTGRNIGVEIFLRLVVDRNLMMFSAFFVQAQPSPLASLVIIIDVHPDNGRHAPEAVDHHADQRAVPQSRQFLNID
jgi:hypothetical protein